MRIKHILPACLLLIGSLAAQYITYPNTTNITGFAGGFDYAKSAVTTAVGYDAFAPTILGIIFLGFFVVGARYTQERALMFASFMSLVASFIMVSGGYIQPQWMMVCFIATVISIFFGNRLG